jgi:TPP-dependent pyruvate/acetoin dehydrogenase alpha subunit
MKVQEIQTKNTNSLPHELSRLNLSGEDAVRLYYYMVLTREFENSILKLYRQGKIIGGAYTGNGNEATSVGSCYALGKTDFLFPMHRDIGAHFVKGQTAYQLYLQHLARGSGFTRGRDGTGHYADPELRIYGNISHLAAMIPLANGVALAVKNRKEESVVLNYIGDGGNNVGDFHEALAMASVMKLPLILIIENNQFAYSTPLYKQYACRNLSDRAIGYGIPGVTIDGTDVLQVYAETGKAVARARAGDGPSLIESVTMRMHGHSAHDDASYVPKEMYEIWNKRDPIRLFEKKLFEWGILDEDEKTKIYDEIDNELITSAEEAVKEPYPHGSEVVDGVFAKI